MTESTKYLLENYKKTFDIHNAILQMEEEILKKFDKGIRKIFSSWHDNTWICPDMETLHEDYCINIARNEWFFENDKNEPCSYIWSYLLLEGDDPIWTFLGLPNEDQDTSVKIEIWLTDQFKQLPDFQELIKEFDERNEALLKEAGFIKKGGSVNRTYEMPIHFSSKAILKGLENDDWEEATIQLKKAWKTIEKTDWDFLKKPIDNHQKKMKINKHK